MSTFMLAKSYTAEAAIGANLIVKVGANDGGILQAAAATDKLMGVCITPGGVASGDRTDVQTDGVAEIYAGGTVSRGDPITSDANGKAVTAAPSAGSNNRIIGFAEVSAAAGDLFRVKLALGVMQG
jgi:hypothetical protein